MLSSCCCHCRMFSMRCTQILMFPTSTDLPMSCTRLQSDTYSVCSSSLMGLTFCWSSRTKTKQEQKQFRGLQLFTWTSTDTQEYDWDFVWLADFFKIRQQFWMWCSPSVSLLLLVSLSAGFYTGATLNKPADVCAKWIITIMISLLGPDLQISAL